METFQNLILFLCISAFGCVMGAYFGTVDYRIRCDEPLVTADCYCPACHHRLPLKDQIPIVSYLFLKGRCRFCQAPIPIRYPLIEGGFLLFYGVSFLLLHGHPLALAIAWYVFFTVLLLLRSHGHYRSAIKAWGIFAGYHLAFSALVLILLSAPHVG